MGAAPLGGFYTGHLLTRATATRTRVADGRPWAGIGTLVRTRRSRASRARLPIAFAGLDQTGGGEESAPGFRHPGLVSSQLGDATQAATDSVRVSPERLRAWLRVLRGTPTRPAHTAGVFSHVRDYATACDPPRGLDVYLTSGLVGAPVSPICHGYSPPRVRFNRPPPVTCAHNPQVLVVPGTSGFPTIVSGGLKHRRRSPVM